MFTRITAIVAACLAVAGIAFGAVEAANASSANAGNSALTRQIQQLQNQESAIQSRLSVAESAAQNAQAEAKNANLAHEGICWNVTYQTDQLSMGNYAGLVSVDRAEIVNGVYTCPQGETFVPIVPQKVNAQGFPSNG